MFKLQKPTDSEQDKPPPSITEEPTNPEPIPDSADNPTTPSIDEETSANSTETDQNDSNNPQNPLNFEPPLHNSCDLSPQFPILQVIMSHFPTSFTDSSLNLFKLAISASDPGSFAIVFS